MHVFDSQATTQDSDQVKMLEELAARSSVHLTSKVGGRPKIVNSQDLQLRADPVVYDIGTAMVFGWYKSLAETTVRVPSLLNYAFATSFSPMSIGVSEGPKHAQLRTVLMLQAIKAKLGKTGNDFPAEIAMIISELGLSIEDATALYQSAVEKFDAVLTGAIADTLAPLISDPQALTAYSTAFTVPEVTMADVDVAISTLSQVYVMLMQGANLQAVNQTLAKAASDIASYSTVEGFSLLQTYYALPQVEMSLGSLLALTINGGVADPHQGRQDIPRLFRVADLDAGASPSQYKYMTISCPALEGRVSILDVITTISDIDRQIFGLSAIEIPLETVLTMAFASESMVIVPAVPTGGSNLLSNGTLDGLLSTSVMKLAMQNQVTPLSAGFSNLLGSKYRDNDQNRSIKISIAERLTVLVHYAGALTGVRRLLSDILESRGQLSYRVSLNGKRGLPNFTGSMSSFNKDQVLSSIGAEVYAVPVKSVLTSTSDISAITAVTELDDANQSLIAETTSSSKRSRKKGTTQALLNETSPYRAFLLSSFDIGIVPDIVIERWWEFHKQALNAISAVMTDPSSARALADPSLILAQPPSFRFTAETNLVVSMEHWYHTTTPPIGQVEDGVFTPQIVLSAIPVPYLLKGRRVFGVSNAMGGVVDSPAEFAFRALCEPSVAMASYQFISLPIGNKGPIDLKGLLSLVPMAAFERGTVMPVTSIGKACATLTSAWSTGIVNLSMSNVQRSMFLRASSALRQFNNNNKLTDFSQLFRNFSLPATLEVSLDPEDLASFSQYAFSMGSDGVIVASHPGTVFVEARTWLEKMFSLAGPLFAFGDYPHTSLTFADADVILNPPNSVSFNGSANPLSVNQTTILLDPDSGEFKQAGAGTSANNKVKLVSSGSSESDAIPKSAGTNGLTNADGGVGGSTLKDGDGDTV